MKTNSELQLDVQNAIKREPLLSPAEIGVTVKDGIVSLTGTVDSYAKKMEAENTAKKVIGVKALVENIVIEFPNFWIKTDAEIATEVLNALNTNLTLPKDEITVIVEAGWVTLEGALTWDYQRESAKNMVQYLTGVKGITSKLKIKSETLNAIEKQDIESALAINWAINDCDIHVDVSERKVTLTGNVKSMFQKEEAGRVAWKTKGIWELDNELIVDYYYQLTY
jgi:osmotically-inducible protein OsmY